MADKKSKKPAAKSMAVAPQDKPRKPTAAEKEYFAKLASLHGRLADMNPGDATAVRLHRYYSSIADGSGMINVNPPDSYRPASAPPELPPLAPEPAPPVTQVAPPAPVATAPPAPMAPPAAPLPSIGDKLSGLVPRSLTGAMGSIAQTAPPPTYSSPVDLLNSGRPNGNAKGAKSDADFVDFLKRAPKDQAASYKIINDRRVAAGLSPLAVPNAKQTEYARMQANRNKAYVANKNQELGRIIQASNMARKYRVPVGMLPPGAIAQAPPPLPPAPTAYY